MIFSAKIVIRPSAPPENMSNMPKIPLDCCEKMSASAPGLMPSLNRLQVNENLSNLKIFAINISQESKKKVDSFFEDLNIKNFDPYFDAPTTLAKTFTLRGVPTSILIDKNGKEFARIMGSIDFNDQIFINWLKTYN